MAVNLYDSQKKAVKMLRPGSILVGEVGSGKSRTALAFYYSKICGGKILRTGSNEKTDISSPVTLVIITTAKKRDSLEWDEELALFCLTRGTNGNGITIYVDSWNNIAKYEAQEGAFFIFDEQRLVGSGSWAKSFWKIAKKNRWILLTATPGDNWNDYGAVFVANGFYRNITQFRNEHVIYDAFSDYPKIKGYFNEKKLEQLRSRITVVIDPIKRATRHHEWVKVGYDEERYTFVTNNCWDIYNNEPARTASILCHTWRHVVNEDNRRLVAIQNILERHPKAIVFYNFDYELESLRHFSEAIEYVYAEWNGHNHEELPKGSKWMYLVQYTAGAEGWNCVETDTVIFYSQNYSGKIMEQACGRIDRMNTSFTDLYYYHIFSDAPIEQTIRRTVNKKQTFSEARFVKSLNMAKMFAE